MEDGLSGKTQREPGRIPSALIEMIQARLPDPLSPEQTDDLCAKLADKTAIQEALQAELSPDQDPGAEHAPPAVTSFDELIAHIEALADEHRRKRWRMAMLRGVLAVVLVIAAIVLLSLHLWPKAPAPGTAMVPAPGRDAAPTRPASTRPASTRPASTRPASAPTSRVADVNLPRPNGADTSTTRPGVAKVPVRMTWQEYAPGGMKGQSDWQTGVGKLFELRTGKQAVMSSDQRYVQLEGTYRLGFAPGPGRMLRLGHVDGSKFDLEFWGGNAAVRVQIVPGQWLIRAHALTRTDFRSTAVISYSCDDQGAWRWHGYGAIDIRYQDGRILICRGEVPLLAVPMPTAPAGANLTCSKSRLWVAEARACRPLALPPRRTKKQVVARTSAVDLTWEQGSTDKAILSAGQGDVVALVGDADNDTGLAWVNLDVTPLVGQEVTVHVRECTALAGMFARVGDTVRPIRLSVDKGKRLVAPHDSRQAAEDVSAGRTVGQEFWVRVDFGLDVIMVWISPDGRTWWPRQPHSTYGRSGQVRIGLEVQQGKGPRRIAVDDVRIRRSAGAIQCMVGVGAELVAEAGAALTYEIMNEPVREQALAMLDEARRDDVDPALWVTACDASLAGGSRHWQVRAEALRSLFQASCDRVAGADVEAVLAGVEELLEITLMQSAQLPPLLKDVFMTLARSCLDAGKLDSMKAVVDATYLPPGSMGLSGTYHSSVMSPDLLRMYLLGLMARGKWESVRLEAMRAAFMAPGGHQSSSPPFVRWALARAQEQLSEEPVPGVAGVTETRRHSLIASDDRQMLNIMGEFQFLVRGKHYEAACAKITSQPLDDMLVSLVGEEDLLQTSHFCIREAIRTTPQLREILKQPRYSQVGMIRLERARRQNDLDAIRSLTVQFYGTMPGLGAMHVLADRDLSNGDFRGAAARYQVLRGEQDYPQRDDAAAKFRLASAMLGRLAGPPVKKPVVLPGGTFGAKEFEQMVRQLVADRKSAGAALTAGVYPPAPGPGGGQAKLTHLADISGLSVRFRYAWARPADFAFDGDRLIVSYIGKLFGIDPGSRQVVWSFEPDGKRRSRGHYLDAEGPARLLRVDDKLYVRCAQTAPPLACFETKTGKRLWSRSYEGHVLSDPFEIGSWVSVLTGKAGMPGTLHLRRIAMDASELSLSSQLVAVRDKLPPIGRPVVVDNAILFRAGGYLVNCDRSGSPRWARRLQTVPATILPELHVGMTLDDMIVWDGKHVIFTAPGCPSVMCVSAESGKMLWSSLSQSPSRLVGLAAGSAIVVQANRICALDPATGKIRWHRRSTAEGTGLLLAQKDTLMLVRLKQPAGGSKDTSIEGRYVRWISATSGRTVREIPIYADPATYGVSQIFSDGKRVFGLSNFDGRKSSKGKIFMIEIPRDGK